jgi:predicted DNA-binding protein
VAELDRIQISAVIDKKLRQRLQHAAIDTGKTQSEIVAEALELWLDQQKL